MTMSRKGKAAIAAGCAIALAAVLYATMRGGAYRGKDASAESEPVRRSLEMIRALVTDASGVGGYMIRGANRQAQISVEEAARRMSAAQAIELKRAQWFGDYLRVEVTCTTAGGAAVDLYFLLKDDGGELRMTGAGK